MYTYLQEVRKNHDEKELRLLHARACRAVENLKTCEAEMIRSLQDVDAKLVYRFLGYNSLYQYALHALRLSESQAWNFITVARKARQFPALQAAIESSELSVSKARKVTAVLDEANQAEWIELAMHSTSREIERRVAAHSPRAVLPEKMRFLNENVLELRLPISESNTQILKRCQDLLSQSQSKPMTLEETIRVLAEFFLERKDPVVKAERAAARISKPVPGQVVVKPSFQTRFQTRRRRALPAFIEHQVHLRDQGRCQQKLPSGEICGETRWFEIHHRVPVAQGGRDVLENLVTLCRAHHQAHHAEAH